MTDPTTIRTDRLLLRPFAFNDVEDVLAHVSDPEFSRFLALPQPYTLKDAEKFVAAQILVDWSEKPNFAIQHDGVVVGAVGLRNETPLAIASLHYAIARRVWNR